MPPLGLGQQMNDELVSVVIPCFQAAEYVGEAIRSALAQTHPSVEVIVVDDGSTDGTAEVVRRFGKRVKLLQEPHRGAAAARNRGWRMARGGYLQFLDADDLLHPEKIARQLQAAGASRQEIVFCDCRIVSFSGEAVRIPVLRPYTGGDPVEFLLRSPVLTTSALYPRGLLETAGGFDEELPCAQEFDLNLRIACLGGGLRHVPSELCTWRQRAGSISSHEAQVFMQFPRIVVRAKDLLEERGRLTPSRRQALAAALARA
ncbi:MAG TPA: glycosyltransferase, partial [Kiritimatiellae bacterium]|nr:glycosyltransferase [Kiritimatiellia bacterium]